MDANGFTEKFPGSNLTEPTPTGQDMGDFLEEYQAPKRGDICTGTVIGTEDRGVIVDVGLKREGLVPAGDLERLDEDTRSAVQIGAEVSVFVLRPEDRDGCPILSIHQAQLSKDWVKAEEMMASGALYEGEVSGHNRGGLIVKFGKIRGFIPASQIVELPKRLSQEDRRQRLADMVGQKMGLRIIEVDRRRRRLIFSQRRALRAWQERQRDRVMDELTEGEVRHGKVTSITNFGAFVDLGGADGLIHVSELGWGRVENPRQVLKVGQEVDVYVLGVDRQRKRIALSLKRLQPDPWTLIDDHYQTNQLVEGRITRVLDFGAFVELDLGVEGLLHASEMLGTPELSPADIVHAGEKLLVKIIRIDSGRRRLALSAKQVRQSEWERWVAEQQAESETVEVAAEEAKPEAEEAVAELVEEAVIELETEEAVAELVEEAVIEPEAEEAVAELVEEAVIEPEAEEAVAELVEEAVIEPEAEEVVAELVEEAVVEPEAEEAVAELVEEAVAELG